MSAYSVGDIAARLTRATGEYVATHRVASTVRRLIELGQLQERRAGRAHILFEDEVRLIEEALGWAREAREGGKAP